MNPLDVSMYEKKSVLVFGELLFDIENQAGSIKELPGGAPANFAYRFLSRQESMHAFKVCLISGVGNDERGKRICQHLKKIGLDTSYIQQSNQYQTGTVNVTKTGNEVSYVINKNVAYDHIEFNNEILTVARNARVFYFGSLIQRNQDGSLQTLRKIINELPEDTVRFVDINLRKNCYSTESLRWSVKNASILKLNDQEWPELSDAIGIRAESARDFAFKLSEKNNITVIVTMAEYGAFAVSKVKDRIECAYEAGYVLGKNFIDPIGCGDTFSAEYARLAANGESLQKCLSAANRLGAAAALTNGGQSQILDQHLAFIDSCQRKRSIIRGFEV